MSKFRLRNGVLMRYSFMKTILFLLFLITPETSWCDGSFTGFLSSYRFTVGVSAYGGEFSVFDKNESPAAGTLSENFTYTPYISLRSPYRFFGESDIGVFMEYDFTRFSLNKQLVGEEQIDLGTSVSGYSAFVTPTLIVSYFGRQPYGENNQSLIFGTGFGLGYLSATGDIIFTETTQERQKINISSAAFALSVFTDYRIGNFSTRIAISMTDVPKSDMEYRYTGYIFRIGYIFNL